LSFFFHVHILFFRHESTLHSFFCFALFFFCTSLISFCCFFAFLFLYFVYILNHTKFLQLNFDSLICVHGHALSSVHFLYHALCLFVFLTVLIRSPTVVFQQFTKRGNQGWLTRWPPWSFTNPIWHSTTLFTLISYYAIVFSFPLMFTDGWFT